MSVAELKHGKLLHNHNVARRPSEPSCPACQEDWTSADAVQAEPANRLPLLRAKIRGGER